MNAVSTERPGGRESMPSGRNPKRGAKLRIKNLDLYLYIVPAALYFGIFAYGPMFGLLIAFKDYNIFKGVFGSEWVGLAHFREMFAIPEFWRMVRNTLMLNALGLAVGFPAPILLALMLGEIASKHIRRISQSLLYLPHFLSWIVLGGMVYAVLSPTYGVVNQILRAVGLQEIYFMASEFWWVVVYTLTDVWQSAGWGTIIYLAAMSAIDPCLYEAAAIDGAGRIRRMRHITIPGILPTVTVLFILTVGRMVSIGVEQPLALQNPVVMDVAQVISTYIYHVGIRHGEFGLTTAVGLVQSVINLGLVLGANYLAKVRVGEGLW